MVLRSVRDGSRTVIGSVVSRPEAVVRSTTRHDIDPWAPAGALRAEGSLPLLGSHAASAGRAGMKPAPTTGNFFG
jgi:hypothetical protein